MFNLEKEIDKYCKSILTNGNDTDSKIAELKDHIYCEIERLQINGLSIEQAFLQATLQLGNVDELKNENAKNWSLTNTIYDYLDWRLPMRPGKAAILQLIVALSFAITIVISNILLVQMQQVNYSKTITYSLLALYFIPNIYLSIAERKRQRIVESQVSDVKQKIIDFFKQQ